MTSRVLRHKSSSFRARLSQLTHHDDYSLSYHMSSIAAISSASADLLHTLATIVTNLISSLSAILHAVIAFFEEIARSVLLVAEALFQFVTKLFSGVLGFVFANFVTILIAVGAYYGYTYYQGGRTGAKTSKKSGVKS